MQATWTLYAKLSALMVLLSLAMAYHYGRHGLEQLPAETHVYVHAADAERGRRMLQTYGCAGCHIIPGVPGAKGKVGPRLDQVTEKVYIAGVLPHSPQNLVAWIEHPKRINPRTAMPDLGVSQQDARDMAAYLYTLR